MIRKRFIIFGVIGGLLMAATVMAATPVTRVVTAKLGGVAGDSFRLDGTLRVRSVFIRDGLDAKYDNSISLLTARNYKGAIDELNLTVGKLMQGIKVVPSGVSFANMVATTTWTATTTAVCDNTLKLSTATVTFSATSATAGTWTSSTYNIFNPGLTGIKGCNSGTGTGLGTYSGSYNVVNNLIMAYNVRDPNGLLSSGDTATAQVIANKIVLTDTRTTPQVVSELVRQ